MLTIAQSDLTPGTHELYIMEFDTEYGHLQTIGKNTITMGASTNPLDHPLESHNTGGSYGDPQGHKVQLWNAEEHFMAIFPDEESLKQGAQYICDKWGDEMKLGIYKGLQEYIAS